MVDFSNYDPESVSNPNNNIFGIPINENDARVVIVPVPWEVTVSYGMGTARAPESIFKASLQVDLYDPEMPDIWKQGFYMRPVDSKILMKSDYLRKEAELYMDYIARQEDVSANHFMSKTLVEVNEGSIYLNNWVFEQTKALMTKNKLVGLLGGDHSISFGYLKALSERYSAFGVLQIDAHCDLRDSYQGFNNSHAGVMYNALKDIPELQRIVQVGVRDYSAVESNYIKQSNYRVITFFDKDINIRQFEGQTWKQIADEIIAKLPEKVYISFDVDGLDPKLCPNTGTPVQGGFDIEQVYYLFSKLLQSGRTIIGFDLCEVGVGESDWDANVGARILLKLCNFLAASNSSKPQE